MVLGVQTLEKIAGEHGFVVNFKDNKTETVVKLRGQRPRKSDGDGESENGACTMDMGNSRVLKIVDSYLHLGSLFSVFGRALREASRRAVRVGGGDWLHQKRNPSCEGPPRQGAA